MKIGRAHLFIFCFGTKYVLITAKKLNFLNCPWNWREVMGLHKSSLSLSINKGTAL